MKIIDENKVSGRPLTINDWVKTKIILRLRIKKNSNGEKLFLIKSKHNNFYIKKNYDTSSTEFEQHYKIWREIIKGKKNKHEIEYIEFSNEKKIKSLSSIAEHISEINSEDPRLILVWVWNPNIKVHIWYKKKKVFEGYKKDFDNIFENHFDIKNKKDWIFFLSFFPTKNSKNLFKGIGWKTIIKEMKKTEEERANSPLLKARLEEINKLTKEMA